MRKYEYKVSAYGNMRDRIAEKKIADSKKQRNKVPYKTIMWQTN